MSISEQRDSQTFVPVQSLVHLHFIDENSQMQGVDTKTRSSTSNMRSETAVI